MLVNPHVIRVLFLSDPTKPFCIGVCVCVRKFCNSTGYEIICDGGRLIAYEFGRYAICVHT